jgi:hypothetical protein
MNDDDFYVRAGQDIYRARGFGKMLEELDAENKEGDDDENFRGIAPLYPSAPTSDIR